VPDFPTADRLPQAVEAVEAFADGLIGLDQLNVARDAVKSPSGHRAVGGRYRRLCECVLSGNSLLWDAAKQVANLAIVVRAVAALGPATPENSAEWQALDDAERPELCSLVRDIFGNPFRPVCFDPAWATATAVRLAASMYEERDFGAVPILGDALEDAGCGDADMLRHLRSPGPHVRGCWVLDLVLGKK